MIAAIVPAAGLSLRMGRPKLILPVNGGQSVLACVLIALQRGGAETVVVVAPPRQFEYSRRIEQVATELGTTVIVPEFQPPDMRSSVELGLREILRGVIRPTTLLLCPADSPGITEGLVTRVSERAKLDPRAIVIPTSQGKRGHPVAIPWAIAEAIPTLPGNVGVNALIKSREAIIIEIVEENPGAILDLDTPEDYRRWDPNLER